MRAYRSRTRCQNFDRWIEGLTIPKAITLASLLRALPMQTMSHVLGQGDTSRSSDYFSLHYALTIGNVMWLEESHRHLCVTRQEACSKLDLF